MVIHILGSYLKCWNSPWGPGEGEGWAVGRESARLGKRSGRWELSLHPLVSFVLLQKKWTSPGPRWESRLTGLAVLMVLSTGLGCPQPHPTACSPHYQGSVPRKSVCQSESDPSPNMSLRSSPRSNEQCDYILSIYEEGSCRPLPERRLCVSLGRSQMGTQLSDLSPMAS